MMDVLSKDRRLLFHLPLVQPPGKASSAPADFYRYSSQSRAGTGEFPLCLSPDLAFSLPRRPTGRREPRHRRVIRNCVHAQLNTVRRYQQYAMCMGLCSRRMLRGASRKPPRDAERSYSGFLDIQASCLRRTSAAAAEDLGF